MAVLLTNGTKPGGILKVADINQAEKLPF